MDRTMEDTELENSDFASEHRMSVLAEAQDLIREIAEPRPVGDTTKSAVRRAWRRLETWTFNRVRDVWNADPRIRVRGDELDALRKVAATRRKETHQKAAADEFSELRARIARLEQLLEQNPPLARAGGDANGRAHRQDRRADRAVD